MFEKHTSIIERASVLEAWKEAGSNPRLKKHAAERGERLFPRFAQHYDKLRALPRKMRRAVQRKWKHTLAGVALLMALGAATPVQAGTTINVPAGDEAALIQAIKDANSETGSFVGPDTIVLANSTFTLETGSYSFSGATGLPVVTSGITIDGNGSTIRRDPTDTDVFRIFVINRGGNLTLQETTVSGGRTSGNNEDGGGVYNRGTLTLTNSTISGNSTSGKFSYGGGMSNYGTLTLTNSTISGNSTSGNYSDGGGVYNRGTLTVTNSTISGNSTSARGGGVYNVGGVLTVTNSTISGNSTSSSRNYSFGGGVFNAVGVLTVTNSTISGNSTSGNYSYGGGVFNAVGTLTVTNSTISGNSTSGNYSYGGGVHNYGGILTVTNSTISGNSASARGGVSNRYGTLTLTRTLISGNTGGSSPEVYDSNGITNVNDFNLFGSDGSSGTNFTPGDDDIVPASGVMVSDILAPLALNPPGTTQTHALVTGSPAIDASPDDASCEATDQRGIIRPQGTACDIGAFELEAEAPEVTCAGLAPTTGCTVNGVVGQLCVGTAGRDRIIGTSGNDVIVGLAGNDTIAGAKGNDLVCGGRGNNIINGGLGNDELRGMMGRDTINGGDGRDRLFGGANNDTLNGGNGNDFMDGVDGTDTCNGGAGTDRANRCETVTSVP